MGILGLAAHLTLLLRMHSDQPSVSPPVLRSYHPVCPSVVCFLTTLLITHLELYAFRIVPFKST